MQSHELITKHKATKKKRIGRGGKRGTYSGKGVKGQKSRAGRKFQPIIREITKRFPKLRGYRYSPREKATAIVNLSEIEKQFKQGEEVSPKVLNEKKIVDTIKGKMPVIKILSKGDVSKRLIVKDCLISKVAKEKIEQAGGKVIDNH